MGGFFDGGGSPLSLGGGSDVSPSQDAVSGLLHPGQFSSNFQPSLGRDDC